MTTYRRDSSGVADVQEQLLKKMYVSHEPNIATERSFGSLYFKCLSWIFIFFLLFIASE